MLVRALTRGFHEKIREEGEEFQYPDDAPVGSWMEVVEEPKKAPGAKPKARPRKSESEGSDEGGEGDGDPLL